MKILLAFILMFVLSGIVFAQKSTIQKISIDNWRTNIVDSLQKINVDTIECYHQYCGECIMATKPPLYQEHACQIAGSWDERINIIIYQQQGKYHLLAFNCSYPPIKKDLDSVNSLSYFISIIPVLCKRDKVLKAMSKKNEYPRMVAVDGRYDDIYLYYKDTKQRVFLHDIDDTKGRRIYFWISKEQKLIDIISSDLSLKN